jgi:hypothetical protein
MIPGNKETCTGHYYKIWSVHLLSNGDVNIGPQRHLAAKTTSDLHKNGAIRERLVIDQNYESYKCFIFSRNCQFDHMNMHLAGLQVKLTVSILWATVL